MIGMDKVGKPTGPGDGGFLVTDQDVPNSVVFEFILTNYNIDGNLLKPEHRELLDQHIVPFAKANKVHAELTGTASRTGTAAYDRELSLQRVDRVRHYLMQKGLTGAQVPVSDMRAVGKDQSTSKVDEDELDRSVLIRIVVGVRTVHVTPHVVIPQIVPSLPPAPFDMVLPEVIIEVDTRVPWAIQELSGSNVGASVGAGFIVGISAQAGMIEYHFLLVNRRTQQMAQCRYFGAGIGESVGPSGAGRSIGPGGGFSLTQGSHTWDNFNTKAGTGFDDFAGSATWNEPLGLGLGTSTSAGKARLTFNGLGVTVEVSTGNAIGTPGSLLSTGNFRLQPPVQLQL
jgi:hypothetical protein